MFPEKFLASNIQSLAFKPSIFLVAEENNSIIGFNAFIANNFILNGKNYVGYQSCWSVTDQLHQGKGVFLSLINEAKQMLKAAGAAFIYGIANNRSNPIITKRLGFIETPAQVLRIPNIPFIRQFYFTKQVLQKNRDACFINEQQVMEHKLLQYPSDVKIIKHNKSWLWGKLARKKNMKYNGPSFMQAVFSLLMRKI